MARGGVGRNTPMKTGLSSGKQLWASRIVTSNRHSHIVLPTEVPNQEQMQGEG